MTYFKEGLHILFQKPIRQQNIQLCLCLQWNAIDLLIFGSSIDFVYNQPIGIFGYEQTELSRISAIHLYIFIWNSCPVQGQAIFHLICWLLWYSSETMRFFSVQLVQWINGHICSCHVFDTSVCVYISSAHIIYISVLFLHQSRAKFI